MNERIIKQLTTSALLCALIIASTLWFKFTIPGTSIMVTLQTFFVLLVGLILSPRFCFYTLGAYLLLGLAGLPVFSAVCGPAVLATPSFGYLLSFPFAAASVSALCKRLSAFKAKYYAAALAGACISYGIALGYIALLNCLYFQTPLSFWALISVYCLPFLPLDIIKAILAAALASKLEKPLHFSALR